LQIHSCHSPMREIEVLHDQLLALFDAEPNLQPNDILVMTPDIETYVPYITAVFDGQHRQHNRIPFSISDRTQLGSNPVVRAFFKLLELGTSRLLAPAVMDLLDLPFVQRRFGLKPEERDLLERWVGETRISWGIDGDDRARQGVPPFEENSWRAGLDRLLLGYALPSEDATLFEGILAFNEVEGSSGQALGRFVQFAEALFEMARDLRRPRTLSEWSESLIEWMNRFLESDEDGEQEFQSLRTGLKHLADVQRLSHHESPVELEVARYVLEAYLKPSEPAVGFLMGGVTFCAMLPMRSIPFQVIALVGMGNRAFPRAQRPVGFDLIASQPRPGDRSAREEDRYLFLEAILSARQKLYISYVGQSIKDNTEIPPSVVVSELIEAVDQGFKQGAGRDGILDHIIIRHKLQAFSPSYFEGQTGLFSYSEENLNALKAREFGRIRESEASADLRCAEQVLHRGSLGSSSPPDKVDAPLHLQVPVCKPFVAISIGEPPEEFRKIDLAELRRFYRNPTAYFLKRRLGLRLEEDKELADGREPFAIHALDAYGLEQELVNRKLAGESLTEAYAAVRRCGFLPAGAAGELVFQDAVASVENFVDSLLPLIQGEPLAPVDFDLTTAGFRVAGRVGQMWPRHLLHYRCASVKAKDRLNLWIDHLLLQTSSRPGYPKSSVLLAKDGGWRLCPPANAQEILNQLLNCYWEGLRKPLPFFPQSAYVFAERRRQGKNDEEALSAARKVWMGDRHSRPEAEDPYYDLNWGNVDPVDERFRELAVTLFGPLLEHEEKLEL
ncbi:MAG TPA: exodeoxyribonuclease V subunit gamma, partial [Terriglobia bacterium]|nr:exodeoxyribonuclease V subunit gamma [Terriglobia bacterium]